MGKRNLAALWGLFQGYRKKHKKPSDVHFSPRIPSQLRKLVLILRGLRLARVARLAKLVNLPLLQELANIVSGPLVSLDSCFAG